MPDPTSTKCLQILAEKNALADFSLTDISAKLRSANLYDFAADSYEDLLLWFSGKRTEAVATLGVADVERKTVGRIFGQVNLKKFIDNYPESIGGLNQKFQKNGLGFQAKPISAEHYHKLIYILQAIHRGIVNLDLVASAGGVEASHELVRKYLAMSPATYHQTLESLRKSYADYINNAPMTERMNKIAIEQLTKLGHLKVSLESKQTLAIGVVLFSELIAAESIEPLIAKKTTSPSDSVIRDAIALHLVKRNFDELQPLG